MSWPVVMYASYDEACAAGRLLMTTEDGTEIRTPAVGAAWPVSPAHEEARQDIGDPVPERYRHLTRFEVMLPNGMSWCPYHKAFPGNVGRYEGNGWEVAGEWPDVTVTPSIAANNHRREGGYHGWLTAGVITDDCEGRVFP